MPEKPKTRNWKNPKTIIATISVTLLLALWNIFASQDRHRTEDADSLLSALLRFADHQDANCPPPAETDDLEKRCLTHTRSS